MGDVDVMMDVDCHFVILSFHIHSILGIPLVVWAFLRSRVYVEWLNYMWHWYLHKIPFLYKHIHWYHHRPMVDSGR